MLLVACNKKGTDDVNPNPQPEPDTNKIYTCKPVSVHFTSSSVFTLSDDDYQDTLTYNGNQIQKLWSTTYNNGRVYEFFYSAGYLSYTLVNQSGGTQKYTDYYYSGTNISYVKYNFNPGIYDSIKYSYNQQGKVSKKYYTTVSATGPDSNYKTYSYNSAGLLTKVEQYNNNTSGQWFLYETFEFTYDTTTNKLNAAQPMLANYFYAPLSPEEFLMEALFTNTKLPATVKVSSSNVNKTMNITYDMNNGYPAAMKLDGQPAIRLNYDCSEVK
jgi:hypothetical protein